MKEGRTPLRTPPLVSYGGEGGVGKSLAWPFLLQLLWMGTWAVCLARVPPPQLGGLVVREDQCSAGGSCSGTHPSCTGRAEPSQAECPLGLGRKLDQSGLGECWVVLAPSLLLESHGCWGGVGGWGTHPGHLVAEPRVKESCSAWLGGRDGDAAREETMQTTLAPGQEVLLLTCRKSPHVVQKYDFIQTFL